MEDKIMRMQDHLEFLRLSLDYSCEDLGDRLGITKQTVRNLELKKRQMSKMQYLAICRIIEDELNSNYRDELCVTKFIYDKLINDTDWIQSNRELELIPTIIEVGMGILRHPDKSKRKSIVDIFNRTLGFDE